MSDKPTAKQQAAQIRNIHIKRLRGIAAIVRSIPMPQADKNRILMGVDGALLGMGADSEAEHRRKMLEKSGLTPEIIKSLEEG